MEEKQPETLTVSVAEEIALTEVGPGTPASVANNEEKLPPEEVEKRQKIMTEYVRLSGRYCPPHNKKSRWVLPSDVQRVVADGRDMVALCALPRGKYSGIAALANSQIEDKDPLRFFVLPGGMVIINPVILNTTKTTILKNEACMSHPEKDIKKDIPRYNKITVMYQTLERKEGEIDPILSKPVIENLSSGQAGVFSHEIGHCNGQNIYDTDFNPEGIKWLGDGPMSDEEVKKLYE